MARDPIGDVVRNLFAIQRMGTSITKLDVGPFIDDLFDDLAAKIARLDPTAPQREAFRRARLEKLVGEIESLVGTSFKEVRKTLRSRLTDIGQQQAAWAAEGLNAWVPEIDIKSARLSRSFLGAILRDDPFEGETLKGWVAQIQNDATVRRVRRALQTGMAENETIAEMITRVRGRSDGRGGFTGGIMETTMREAEAIVRTGVNFIANRAHLATYAENTDVLKGLQFTAVLDERTCPICQALDGEILDAENPDPAKVPPRHLRDRCVLVPVVDWEGLGIEPPPEATRASADGQVPSSTTYEDWLRDQSAATQDEILGPARAELFRDGKIGLKDLVTGDQRIVPLDELVKIQSAPATGGLPQWRRDIEGPELQSSAEAAVLRERLQEKHGGKKGFQEFARAVDEWTESDKSVAAIKGEVSDTLSGQRGSTRARALVSAVRSSPASAPELYRGITFPGSKKELLAKHAPGTRLRWGMSSFTSETAVAGQFAERGGRVVGGIPVVFRMMEGARAAKIENLSSLWEEREWYTTGRFEVEEVNDRGRLVQIVVRQISPSWD